MSQEDKKSKAALLFCSNLRKQLERSETTQRTLASDLGVGEVAVSNWINGSRFPTEKFIVAIAEYFNIPMCTLFMTNEEYTQFVNSKNNSVNKDDNKPSNNSSEESQYDFSLEINNDEMSPDFQRGDTVYCKAASSALNGDFVVVNIQGRNIIRRIYFNPGSVLFVCTNPKYSPQQYSTYNSILPKIIGVPVSYKRGIK